MPEHMSPDERRRFRLFAFHHREREKARAGWGGPKGSRSKAPTYQRGSTTRDPAGVTARVFPTWFTCDGFGESSETGRRRRLVPWNDLDTTGGRTKFQREDGKK